MQQMSRRKAMEQLLHFIGQIDTALEAGNEMGRPVDASIGEMGWDRVLDAVK